MLISGFGTLETAIEAVRAGAFDYISKPFAIAEVKRIVERALPEHASRGAGRPRWRRARRKPHRANSTDARGLQADRTRGRLVRAGADRGRERRRARSWSRGPSTSTASCARSVCRHQLRRDCRYAARVGAVRTRRGSFTGAVADHKGVFEQAAELARCCSTRSVIRRRRCRCAGCCVLEEVRSAAGGATSRFVCRRGSSPRPTASRAGGRRGHASVRTLLPAERRRHPRSSAAGAARGHPAADRRALLDDACRRAGQKKGAVHRSARGADAHRGRGTSASCETRSSGWWRRAGARRSKHSTPHAVLQPVVPRASEPFADLPTLEDLERRYLLHVLEAVKAIERAPPKSSASIVGRCTGWRSASGST